MTNLLLSDATERSLQRVLTKTPHALLINADAGAGKLTFARLLAAKVLDISGEQLLNQSYYREFIPTGTSHSVTIDTIREVKAFLRLKTTGIKPIRRVIVVEDAHTMTIEAQNALLKVLEEPPLDTMLILTVATTLTLKPTIMSRAQSLRIHPPTEARALDYFANLGFSQTNIKKAYMLSDGQVGLMTALLEEDTSHPLVSGIEQAKQLLASSRFERVAAVDALSKQKDQLPVLLQSFKRIARAALAQAMATGKADVGKRWQSTLQSVHDAEATLGSNPNSKLLLTHFLLNL